MQADAIEKGAVLEGEYILLEPLGDEGGRVYRATQLRTHKPMVVRMWRGEVPMGGERLHDLLATAARIRHPALAAVEAFGKQPDGTWFIVSELSSGEPLDAWADKIGIPPLPTAVDILARVCVGLNAAHRNGLAHDALNPRNVFVVQDAPGMPPRVSGKLLDLGVPACMRPWPPRLSAAQFMAPEQLARALRADAAAFGADSRMNVYSCGALLYSLCTGGAPVQGRNLEELALAHERGKLVPPIKINPQISRELDAIILRALSTSPDERFPSVAEFAAALARVRPSRTASGVRPLALSASLAAGGPKDALQTWDPGFDERPTSESKQPLSPATVPPSPLSPATVPPSAPASAPRETARPPRMEGSASSAPPPKSTPSRPPAGSFSAPLPLQPPKSPPPARPQREVVDAAPASVPITVLLEEPAAIERAELAAIVPKEKLAGSYVVAPYRVVSAAPRPRGRHISTKLRPLLLVACAALGWFGVRWLVPAAGGEVTTSALPAADAAAPAPEPAAAPRSSAALAPKAPAAEIAEVVAEQETAPDDREPEPKHRVQARSTRAVRNAPPRAPARPRPAPVQRAAAEPADAAFAPAPANTPEPAQEPDALEPSPSPPSELASDARERPNEGLAAAPIAPPPTPEPTRADPAPVSRSTAPAKAPPPAPVPLAAKARVRDLEVQGSLATSEVRRAVARIAGQFERCYALAARAAGRNGFGVVSVQLEIDVRGRARSPRAQGGGLPGLDRCVAGAARDVYTRPPDTGTVRASWKVAYEP